MIDQEEATSKNYEVFISELRSYIKRASKPIYLSAAPLCTLRKKPTISRDTLALVDFIFIRFYNAAACSMGTPGFSDSVKQWYSDILPSPHLPFPKVLLGGLSFDNGKPGYVPAEKFREAVRTARHPKCPCPWNVDKFGGVMLWDGPRGLDNRVSGGSDYVTSAKNALIEK